MRALLLMDDLLLANGDPSQDGVKFAANAVMSMGITPVYYTADNANPLDSDGYNRVCADANADLVIVPRMSTGNRVAFAPLCQSGAENGGTVIPVIIQGTNTVLTAQTPGLASTYAGDLNDTAKEAEIVSTGGTVYTYNKRFLLETDTLTGSEAVYPLVQGVGTDVLAVAAAEYTPDGTHWVYYGNYHLNGSFIHLMMQAAINRGVFAKPPHPSPCILNIDHINGAGEGSGGGTAITGQPVSSHNGTIGDPDRIKVFGDILRSANGVCYASLEQNNYVGASAAADMVANQINRLVEYSDVYKYMACHDHSTLDLSTGTYLVNPGASANNAINGQETKVKIDASYQATKTGAEAMGLKVQTDFGHFASNAAGLFFWELAQDKVDITCDPDGLEAIQGYGFKMGRVGANVDNSSSYPSVGGKESAHWLYNRISYREIILVPSKDGDSVNGAAVDAVKDTQAFSLSLSCIQENQIVYFHDTDMEDPDNNIAGTLSDGDDVSRMQLSWQTGANYQFACSDTFDFGADITKYVPLMSGTNL